MNTHSQDLIRERAYALWEASGRPEGHEIEHWMQAERELAETDSIDLSEQESEVGLPPTVAGLPVH
jgi:hypothetical protein